MESKRISSSSKPTSPRRTITARKAIFLVVTILFATLSVFSVMTVHTHTNSPALSAGLTNCGAPVHITLSQLEALTTAGIIPDKRSLTPPCSVTYNGQTYPTYVEMDAITIEYTPYTGDCDAVISGYCDVHLEFACTISAGCLFEIDQTWFAAGYTYPVNTQGAGSITSGTVVNATGFLYVDDHGIHELHPTVSVVVQGAPPPPSCSNGAIDPPSCTTCPTGYVLQNGTCVVPSSPLSTSFAFAPLNPSVSFIVSFASMTTGGTGPYAISWKFGDGATATGASVTHSYGSTGSFTATETAADSSTPSLVSTVSKIVVVSPSSPPSSLSVSIGSMTSSVIAGQTSSFSGAASGGTAPYTYAWSFGDGGTGQGAVVSYAYSTIGIYTVTLSVSDSKGLINTASGIVSVVSLPVQLNNPPSLTVPTDQTVAAGNSVSFSIQASDPDNGEVLIVTAHGLPSGATFDSDTFVFYWKPSTLQLGTYGVMFVAADNGSPVMSVAKPVTIHVMQAATGPGSTGGSGGGSSSGCFYCGLVPQLAVREWLLVLGGLVMVLVAPLALMVFRARSRLDRVKRHLERTGSFN